MERNYRGRASGTAGRSDRDLCERDWFRCGVLTGKLVKLSDVYVGVESVQAVPGYAGVYAVQVGVPGAMAFGAAPVQLQIMTPDTHQLNSNTVTAVFEAVRQ